jgi:hypothetical protein
VAFNAQVVFVLIASPTDTHDARAVVRETLSEWNSVNAEAATLILLPLMSESDAIPEVGDRPQSILNRQLVDRADIVIATFWTRLGTPTGVYALGAISAAHEPWRNTLGWGDAPSGSVQLSSSRSTTPIVVHHHDGVARSMAAARAPARSATLGPGQR